MPDMFRLATFTRDGACFCCGTMGAAEYNAHHRQLKSGGGPDTLENRVTLHGSGTTGCHGYAHEHRVWAAERGYIVSRYADPARVAVTHYSMGKVYLTRDGRVVREADVVAWDLTRNVPLTEGDQDG